VFPESIQWQQDEATIDDAQKHLGSRTGGLLQVRIPQIKPVATIPTGTDPGREHKDAIPVLEQAGVPQASETPRRENVLAPPAAASPAILNP
jgi:hypothetical protein